MYIYAKSYILAVVCSMLLFPTHAFSQDEQENLRAPGKSIAEETTNTVLSKWPIGFPSADMNIENAVPMDEILKVASYEARRTWGHVSPISEIPCCDQDGDVVAFLVVFQLHPEERLAKSSSRQSYAAILKEIQEARQQYSAAHTAFKKARREMDKRIHEAEKRGDNRMTTHQETGGANTPQPEIMSIPPTQSFKDAYALRENIRKKMTGAGQFGTVLVSARFDLIPVPVVMHGLPLFYTRGDLLQKKADECIGGSPTLRRIYLAGPLDQWYEFSNSKGDSLLVDPFKGKTYPIDKISELMPKEILMKAEPDIVSRKWNELRKAAKEEQK